VDVKILENKLDFQSGTWPPLNEVNAGTWNPDGSTQIVAPNSPPSLTVNSSTVMVTEGQTATNSGNYSDPNASDNVTITASVGTITKTGTNSGTWNWSYTPPDGPATLMVTITATDSSGARASTSFTVTVNNVPPSVTFTAGPATVNESGVTEHQYSYSISDPGDDTVQSVATSCGSGIKVTNSDTFSNTGGSFKCKFPDGPADTQVSAKATDSDGETGAEATLAVYVNNVPPVITSVTGPTGPIALTGSGASATVTAYFTDAGSLDTHTCTLVWDDGFSPAGTVNESAGNGSCSGTHIYTKAGVYTVQVTVTDDDNGTANSKYEFVVVYDPTGGFVTGGGWINSPAGACMLATCQGATGRANFGFVSKYQKGATVPTGETEFQFKAGNLNFKSTSYEWLVVSGPKAQYKGEGTINGTGKYGFLLTATDGQVQGGGGVDKFRIKIWDKVTGQVVYDNVPSASDDIDSANPQEIGGGSIVIHSK
jgi:hypothetical protein